MELYYIPENDGTTPSVLKKRGERKRRRDESPDLLGEDSQSITKPLMLTEGSYASLSSQSMGGTPSPYQQMPVALSTFQSFMEQFRVARGGPKPNVTLFPKRGVHKAGSFFIPPDKLLKFYEYLQLEGLMLAGQTSGRRFERCKMVWDLDNKNKDPPSVTPDPSSFVVPPSSQGSHNSQHSHATGWYDSQETNHSNPAAVPLKTHYTETEWFVITAVLGMFTKECFPDCPVIMQLSTRHSQEARFQSDAGAHIVNTAFTVRPSERWVAVQYIISRIIGLLVPSEEVPCKSATEMGEAVHLEDVRVATGMLSTTYPQGFNTPHAYKLVAARTPAKREPAGRYYQTHVGGIPVKIDMSLTLKQQQDAAQRRLISQHGEDDGTVHHLDILMRDALNVFRHMFIPYNKGSTLEPGEATLVDLGALFDAGPSVACHLRGDLMQSKNNPPNRYNPRLKIFLGYTNVAAKAAVAETTSNSCVTVDAAAVKGVGEYDILPEVFDMRMEDSDNPEQFVSLLHENLVAGSILMPPLFANEPANIDRELFDCIIPGIVPEDGKIRSTLHGAQEWELQQQQQLRENEAASSGGALSQSGQRQRKVNGEPCNAKERRVQRSQIASQEIALSLCRYELDMEQLAAQSLEDQCARQHLKELYYIAEERVNELSGKMPDRTAQNGRNNSLPKDVAVEFETLELRRQNARENKTKAPKPHVLAKKLPTVAKKYIVNVNLRSTHRENEGMFGQLESGINHGFKFHKLEVSLQKVRDNRLRVRYLVFHSQPKAKDRSNEGPRNAPCHTNVASNGSIAPHNSQGIYYVYDVNGTGKARVTIAQLCLCECKNKKCHEVKLGAATRLKLQNTHVDLLRNFAKRLQDFIDVLFNDSLQRSIEYINETATEHRRVQEKQQLSNHYKQPNPLTEHVVTTCEGQTKPKKTTTKKKKKKKKKTTDNSTALFEYHEQVIPSGPHIHTSPCKQSANRMMQLLRSKKAHNLKY
jgi:hypothetical protein